MTLGNARLAELSPAAAGEMPGGQRGKPPTVRLRHGCCPHLALPPSPQAREGFARGHPASLPAPRAPPAPRRSPSSHRRRHRGRQPRGADQPVPARPSRQSSPPRAPPSVVAQLRMLPFADVVAVEAVHPVLTVPADQAVVAVAPVEVIVATEAAQVVVQVAAPTGCRRTGSRTPPPRRR